MTQAQLQKVYDTIATLPKSSQKAIFDLAEEFKFANGFDDTPYFPMIDKALNSKKSVSEKKIADLFKKYSAS